MVDESSIREWLTNSKYHNPDVTLREIVNVIKLYQGLIPQSETYMFNDGTQMNLVNLCGTIPVRYKGVTYNIPICIWLMDTHPKNAPICYVKPTSDMAIKVSMYVDQNGKIYLPYLHDWVPHTSELLGLIQVMIVTFGEQPPVYAKPRPDTNLISGEIMPQPLGNSSYLPYPASSTPYQPGGYGSYPPYPTTSASGFPPYPQFPAPYPPYPPNTFTGPVPTPPAASAGSGGTGTIKDEHIRESLLTAIQEKLMRRMKEQFQQNLAELETLRRTQEELRQGRNNLDDMLQRLEKEKNELNKSVSLLKEKEQELEKVIERLDNQEPVEVDDAITTTAPLYKQLLNSYAEEAALEDVIYYLGEALRCGVIDLDMFLRQVRVLSRKQFMLRALMQKCRQKAGLSV